MKNLEKSLTKIEKTLTIMRKPVILNRENHFKVMKKYSQD